MQIIPVTDTYAQTFSVTLGGQDCTLNLYQRPAGLFIDVSVAGTLVIGGVICRNTTRVVRDAYLGFIGDLLWLDNQGQTDPASPGLGTRYSLVYLEASEVPGYVVGASVVGGSVIVVTPPAESSGMSTAGGSTAHPGGVGTA